ncbi:MAG: hypothetical protein EA417_00910 [Gammaproteobacteria bacterium]|nr:MAG: hypothetical protein EA417_00910 [Gammaproteobacteria bacterium]
MATMTADPKTELEAAEQALAKVQDRRAEVAQEIEEVEAALADMGAGGKMALERALAGEDMTDHRQRLQDLRATDRLLRQALGEASQNVKQAAKRVKRDEAEAEIPEFRDEAQEVADLVVALSEASKKFEERRRDLERRGLLTFIISSCSMRLKGFPITTKRDGFDTPHRQGWDPHAWLEKAVELGVSVDRRRLTP